MQELLKNIGLLHEGKKNTKNSNKLEEKNSSICNNSIKSFSDFDNQSEDVSFCKFFFNI